jgi:Fe2+ or Zn2+ uptake regulation protein
MGSAPPDDEDIPVQVVLNALDDPDCRAILRETSQPMTAKELSDACDIAESTVYRKLDLVSRATLVREFHDVNPERGRITRYQRDADGLNLAVTDDGIDVVVDRPTRTVDERLADMWSEMGDEL